MTTIGEAEFDYEYCPLPAPSGESVWEHKETLAYPPEQVWTLIDGEDGNGYAIAGYHLVNKFGYVVTEKPWQNGDEEALWFEANDDEQDKEDSDVVLV